MGFLLAEDVDPSLAKRAKREAREEAGANSFAVIALEWFNTRYAIVSGRSETDPAAHLVDALRPAQKRHLEDFGKGCATRNY